MSNRILLLPETVANQIAAGEVIQRPASVVKELLENSVDAGSSSIHLIIKEAGKTLIQVVDNGIGMSETDARMCYERHATSKIKKAEDLFNIQTMGFRGEAMASIASVAHVEMKTRTEDLEVGTLLEIEGNKITRQESVSCPKGTSISVKNLFFNVPARRKFLKTDSVEMRHIIDEFERVALANPHIAFTLHHNEQEMFQLHKGTFKQRIIGIFGKNFEEKLVPVEEDTTIIKVKGFVGKPDTSRKTKGEQFLFVNNRFIRSNYLHSAIQLAYKELISDGFHPAYFLNLTIDPANIDVNIHPTKTEIKFDDEKAIFAIVRSAIKKSLGQYNIAPSLDFNQEASLTYFFAKDRPLVPPSITVDTDYNPFAHKNTFEGKSPTSDFRPSVTKISSDRKMATAKFYEDLKDVRLENDQEVQQIQIQSEGFDENGVSNESAASEVFIQIQNKYILTQIKTGCVIIDQKAAHERILYDQFLNSIESQSAATQQLLFPTTLEYHKKDAEVLKELIPSMVALGFDISEFGGNSYIVHGIPVLLSDSNVKQEIDSIIENVKLNGLENPETDMKHSIARALAVSLSIKTGKKLVQDEMKNLFERLFACTMPYYSPSGKKIMIRFTSEDIDQRFEQE